MQFYGRQANDFPQDWIQEFQVLTNAIHRGIRSSGRRRAQRDHAQRGERDQRPRATAFSATLRFDSRRRSPDATMRTGTRFSSRRHPRSSSSGSADSSAARYRRTSSSSSAGSSACRLDSSEVLGISNYWRQFVTDTIVPTGQRSTVGLVKVDLNVEYQQSRIRPLHQHAPARLQRARDVAGIAGPAQHA